MQQSQTRNSIPVSLSVRMKFNLSAVGALIDELSGWLSKGSSSSKEEAVSSRFSMDAMFCPLMC